MSERDKLEINLGGVADMQRPPDAMFVVDMKSEEIGVREAQRLKIPIIGLVDTNCSPDPVDYVIPGNDDAIRSCKVIIEAIAERGLREPCAVPRPGGAGPARARGGRAPRARGDGSAARPRRPSGARPRSAPAARPRRRGFSPDEPATPAPAGAAPRERRTFDPDEEA